MNPLKKTFFKIAAKIDIDLLKKASGLNLLVPFHHLVSDEDVPYIKPLYGYKSVNQFENDLDFLLKHFKPVSLSEVVEQAKTGRPFSEKSFLITFDDALKQVHDIAMPLLLKKGVPAAVFLSPLFVDNKELFYDFKKGLLIDYLTKRVPTATLLDSAAAITGIQQLTTAKLIAYVRSVNYLQRHIPDELGLLFELDFEGFLKKEKPFMSTHQIKNLIDKGFEVGAHSMTHPLYRLIPLAQQLAETQESIDRVDKTFHPKYKVFAFPHVDTGVENQFFNAVFSAAAWGRPDLVFGNRTAMLEQNPLMIHRFIGENPLISAEAICKAVLLFNTVNQWRGKAYVTRN